MENYQLFETEHFVARQADGYRIPGYVIIMSKSARTALADFSAAEQAELMQCIARAEALVQKLIQPERIYVMKFAEVNQTVHFHVFPRTAAIGKAFATAQGEPAPYNGARLVDWIWDAHTSLQYSDTQIEDFIIQARAL